MSLLPQTRAYKLNRFAVQSPAPPDREQDPAADAGARARRPSHRATVTDLIEDDFHFQ